MGIRSNGDMAKFLVHELLDTFDNILFDITTSSGVSQRKHMQRMLNHIRASRIFVDSSTVDSSNDLELDLSRKFGAPPE